MRLTLLFFTLFIAGCDLIPPEQAMMEKYHQRLANVLDVSTTKIAPPPAIIIPRRRELFQPLPRLSLGLLESYQLRQCGLFNLLADKNSQLGKVQDSFHDMDYQISLLRTLNSCITNFSLSDEERAKLDSLYSQKWNQLHTHIDNLLLTSGSMQKQLTASDWLHIDHKHQIARIDDFFNILGEMYDTQYKAISRLPNANLVNYQEEIEKTRLIGKLYYSLAHVTLWLNETTQMLETNQSKIACGENRDITQFRYLHNVFQTIYAKEIQPYLAYLDGTYLRLNVGIKLIEKRMALHGETYKLIETHHAFREKTLEHMKFWQGLFKRCGVTVGNVRSN